MEDRSMSLELALSILAEAHTRDDSVAGFVIEMSPSIDYFKWSKPDYIAAWEVVRRHLKLPTKPTGTGHYQL